MAVIELNDGKIKNVNDNNDIIELVNSDLSYELGTILSDRLIEIDEAQLYAEERACTDADSYLASLEEKTMLLQDVLDEIVEIEKYMTDSKRINKDKIFSKLCDMEREINSEL